MGLVVSVGIERQVLGYDEEAVAHYRSQFGALSAELAKTGITWAEPDATADLPSSRARLVGFGYSTVHYLRRVYALQARDDEVTPVPPGEELDDEPEDEEIYNLSSHLVCHSDCDGYYIPVDFDDPLYLDTGSVGSSQRLLRELADCARHIGITLSEDGTLSDEEAARVANGAADSPYPNEWDAWLALFEAARISIATGHAVVFH
ncbi:hypothetical protein [Actinocrispum wychmicini]|uniref:Uncharacterized protein n=1 Tax=Actinocrispum wychmicini TaxID=1213861 RepID=A0A4R2JWB5_9PSEU|nr:hypothetical protein [Actinocrispum wychmicini]TCO58455.1 hypothetical protein EV192_105524 [Actinocrispum wychmicini]